MDSSFKIFSLFHHPRTQKEAQMEDTLAQLKKLTSQLKDKSLFTEDHLSNFQSIFQFAINTLSSDQPKSKLECLEFLLASYQSLDHLTIRKECFKLVGICIINFLTDPTKTFLFSTQPRIKHLFTNWKEKELSSYNFLQLTNSILNGQSIELIIKFIELIVILMDSLSTRKYIHLLLEENHFVSHISLTYPSIVVAPIWSLFLNSFLLPIDNFNGIHQSINEYSTVKKESFVELQKRLYLFLEGNEPLIKRFCLVPINLENIQEWSVELFKLIDIYKFLTFLSIKTFDWNGRLFSKEVLFDSFVLKYSLSNDTHQIDTTIYPTEQDLKFISEMEQVTNGLPKIGIQFLSQKEYFVRNFDLYKKSVTFDIKQDVEDCIQRMQPFLAGKNTNQRTTFAGWSRFAVELEKEFEILQVVHSTLQDSVVGVQGCIQISLQKYNETIQREWNSLRAGEALFLLQITSNSERAKEAESNVTMLRGCSLVEMQDNDGNVIPFSPAEQEEESPKIYKSLKLIVSLDPLQHTDSGYSFNLLMRRNPKENNFKWTLEWIRDCIKPNEPKNYELFPTWFRQPFLGYGNPSEHSGNRKPSPSSLLLDAIVSLEHLKSVFSSWTIDDSIVDFRNVQFDPSTQTIFPSTKPIVFPPSYVPNQIPFTTTQLSAILSGISPGISLIVGPPGTGKTDVTAQLIKTLFLTESRQKILIVSHSNYALNLLFERLYSFDPLINSLEIVRLGHGEEELMQFHSGNLPDFSKYGRMNAWLEYKNDQLKIVQVLAESLGYSADYFWLNCENANYFFDFYVVPVLEQCKLTSSYAPFETFLASAEFQLENNYNSPSQLAPYLQALHASIKQLIPFEVLRNDFDRARFCLANNCRIIATTSTFLSLKRDEFKQLLLDFSTVIVEEAGQILDIECSLAISLASNSLKRLVMIGDHQQLPPIVKCKQLCAHSNFDQSLFHRFIRQGIPTVQLDQQARCRPQISSLFCFFYQNQLTNMQNHLFVDQFSLANPAFLHPVQFINVPDLNGEGESEPLPHYFQNLAEAEWIVATYQYMRLVGYPADQIAILSPYNGQVALIQEILRVRCAPHQETFGPSLPVVSTVDKFQGRQANFVLLSLVRTKSSIGHLNDIRRFIVAMSRARLGLYIFGRKSLFVNQLNGPIGKIFQERITVAGPLELVPDEGYFDQSRRRVGQVEGSGIVVMEISDPIQMAILVNQLIEQKQ